MNFTKSINWTGGIVAICLLSSISHAFTKMSCSSGQYAVQCSADDKCSPPPPGPNRMLGTVAIVNGQADLRSTLTFASETIPFEASVFEYTTANTPTQSSSISFVVNNGSDELDAYQNEGSTVSATYVKKAKNADGSYKKSVLSASCELN